MPAEAIRAPDADNTLLDRRARSAASLRLAVQVAALAVAGAAQYLIAEHGWAAAAAFLTAAVLFAATRGKGAPALWPAPDRVPRTGWGFWAPFVIGIALCAAAGVAVRRGGAATPAHALWGAGLGAMAAAAGLSRSRAAARPSATTVAALGLLIAVSAGLFCWRLSGIPPEVHGDDAHVGLDAIRLLQERPFNLFRVGWYYLPIFHAFPTAVGLKLAGINLTGLRGTSAVLGMVTVLLSFAAGRRLWGDRVGLPAGLVLATTPFFIHLSRAGYHYIDTPLLSVLALVMFLAVWRELRAGAAVWCGIALGLGVQTYYASRLVPVALTVTFAVWLIGSERRLLWPRLLRFGVIAAAALATAAPMIAVLSEDTFSLWERTRETTVFSAANLRHLAGGYGTGDLRQVLFIQLRIALGMFHVGPDSSVQFGRMAGLLDPISGALFPLGLGLLAARLRDRGAQAVLLWIALPLFVAGVLTIDTPFFPRLGGLLPFVALTIALAMAELLAGMREALGKAGPAASAAAGAVLFAAIFAINIHAYFVEYAPNYRHNSPAVEIAAWVRENGAGRTTYMVSDPPHFSMQHGSIRFLTYGYETADIENLEAYTRSNRLPPESSAFVFLHRDRHLIERVAAALGPLEVEEHRDYRGEPGFFTAVPRAR